MDKTLLTAIGIFFIVTVAHLHSVGWGHPEPKHYSQDEVKRSDWYGYIDDDSNALPLFTGDIQEAKNKVAKRNAQNFIDDKKMNVRVVEMYYKEIQ